MARGTENRILSCVPPFLSTRKQFELIALQVPNVLHTPAFTKTYGVRASQLDQVYDKLAREALDQEYNLDWFVREVFSSDEVNEFLELFRFVILNGIQRSYIQIQSDLLLAQDILLMLPGRREVSYRSDTLGCWVDIDQYPCRGIRNLAISIPEPKLASRFRAEYQQVFIEHQLEARRNDIMAINSQGIGLKDVKTFADQLERVGRDREYESQLEVRGQAGLIRVRLKLKSVRRLRGEMITTAICLVSLIVASLGACIWMLRIGAWPLVLVFGIVIARVGVGLMGKMSKLKAEVIEYERT